MKLSTILKYKQVTPAATLSYPECSKQTRNHNNPPYPENSTNPDSDNKTQQ